MKIFLILLLLSPAAHAEFNGERWGPIGGIEWYLGSGCPDYVLDVAHEIMAKGAPVRTEYMGELSGPSSIVRDGKTIIFCSEDMPAQAAETPEPDIGSNQMSTVAGLTKWWYSTGGQFSFIQEADVWLRLSTLNEQTAHRYLWHELGGHALGLLHDPDPRSLMYYMPRTNEPFIYDLAELSRLYNQCEPVADSNANLFIPGVDMTDWILRQPTIVQEQFEDFIGEKVSFVQEFATMYPDTVKRVALSVCD